MSNCKCSGTCNTKESCCKETGYNNVTYKDIPLGLKENLTGIEKPSDGFYPGMRIFLTGIRKYAVVKEVRYKECVVIIDNETRDSIFNCKFMIPEEEGKKYENTISSILSPAPPDPFK